MLKNPEFTISLLQTLQSEKEKSTALQTRIAEITPKAKYYDMILQTQTAVPVSLIAKDYDGMSAMAFNRLLHDLKIQYKISSTWLLYQAYADLGYALSRTYYTGENTAVLNTYWTQKRLFFLYNALKDKNRKE